MNSKEFYAKKLELLADAKNKFAITLAAIEEVANFEEDNIISADVDMYEQINSDLNDMLREVMGEFDAVQAMVDLSNV